MSEPRAGEGGNDRVAAHRTGRGPLIFAIVGVAVALLAGGAYVYRQATAPPPLTPEETVREFLAAVFLAGDPTRVGTVVCASWKPEDAIDRTRKEIGADISVSWDQISVSVSDERRATVRARVGLRFKDDVRPAAYQQWRFDLVKENGWRVCDARPFVV